MMSACMRHYVTSQRLQKGSLIHQIALLNASRLTVLKQNIRYFCKRSQELTGVVGLEIHAQISANSKLFSGASAKYGAAPNSCVSIFDSALPGTLPVLNKRCVEAAVRTGLALGCHINRQSTFDRKHYFYADLPAGYQITQYRKPIAVGGSVEYILYTRGKHKVATKHRAQLTQIQLEQDSGKSLHDEQSQRSLIDLNRAGVALMEIITFPDFNNGDEAAAFIREVQSILRLINTCDGKMEEGSMRVDANVSVHYPGEPLGVRTEVKNLNSIKSVQEAVDYEIKRQKKLIGDGGIVINETMSYDNSARKTVPMRDKERLQDYRFIAEPNLPPVVLCDGEPPSEHIISITEQASILPELREDIRNRLLADGLKLEHVATLMELNLVKLHEALRKLSPFMAVPTVFAFLYQVVMMFCGERDNMTVEDLTKQVSIEDMKLLLEAVAGNTVTMTSAKTILHQYLDSGEESIRLMISSDRYSKISDHNKISELATEIISKNPKLIKQYKKKGKSVFFNQLLHELRKSTEYRVDHADAVKGLNYALKLTEHYPVA